MLRSDHILCLMGRLEGPYIVQNDEMDEAITWFFQSDHLGMHLYYPNYQNHEKLVRDLDSVFDGISYNLHPYDEPEQGDQVQIMVLIPQRELDKL